MERFAIGALRDLFATGETVGDDDGVSRCGAHLWQDDALADADGDIDLVALEPERPGHTAAAGVGMFDVESHRPHHALLRLELHHRPVLTVGLHERLALDL